MRRLIALTGSCLAILHGPFPSSADAQPLFGNEIVHFAQGPALVNSVAVGSFRIRLGQTTLAQVMSALGPSKVVETGDAGDYLARLCYQSADPSNPTYLVLESNEMGGSEYVMGFQISRGDARRDADLPCAALQVGAKGIVVTPGLELGARQRRLLARFGPAQADSCGFVRYAHGRGLGRTEADEWTELSVLDLEFRADTLVWLGAWKVISR